MLVGVKFCGGCNEGYDRDFAFRLLKSRFERRVCFEYAQKGKKYDALLLISGCTNRCASIDEYDYDNKLISVWRADTVDKAIELMEDYL